MNKILPEQFCRRMQQLLGEEYNVFLEELQKEPYTTIRINREKGDIHWFQKTLVPWCSLGYYLSKRPKFVFDPIFHAGGYYVQEASSMFLAYLVQTLLDQPVLALDLCAAPGGKSTLLLDYLPKGSFLVANEVIRSRSWILYENCVKWGHAEVIVSQVNPSVLAESGVQFDFILADLPCSGEGMFRKDDAAISDWSLENIRLCVERGRRILDAAWITLKPGGLFIYSTCTFNTEENEAQMEYLVSTYGAEPIMLEELKGSWGIKGALRGNLPIYRFFPHQVMGEGLSMGVFRKPISKDSRLALKKTKKKEHKLFRKKANFPDYCKKWVKKPEHFEFILTEENKVLAIPKEYFPEVSSFIKDPEMKMLKVGLCVAELKGKDYVPTQELAMSIDLNSEIFPEWILEKEEALNYLRREALTPPDSLPKGWIRVTYANLTLGWVKNIGNRANNLFPQEWKIRIREKSGD